MTIRRILAVYAGAPSDDSMMSCATLVARRFGAHIDAVYAREAADIPDLYDVLPAEEVQVLHEHLQTGETQREAATQAAFESFMERAGLAHAAAPGQAEGASACWESVGGRARGMVERHGGAYDLIVIGQPASDPEPRRLRNTEIIEAALSSTGRPVLVAPAEPPRALGTTVLIGWNRSAQSARAFHAAKTLLLDRATKVRIVSVTTGAKDGPEAAEIAADLAWHGIACDIRELSPDHRSVGTVLLAEADVIGADLLVMGAYSQSRLRQILLGGVTRHLLSNATIPLFMAH